VKKQIATTALIYIATAFFAFGGNHLEGIIKTKISNNIKRPLGRSFSFLSITQNKKALKHDVFGFLPYWSLEQVKHLHLDKLTDIAYFALSINSDGSIKKIDIDEETGEKNQNSGYFYWQESKTLGNLIREAEKNGVRISLTIISHDADTTDTFLMCKNCWETFYDELEKELKYRNVPNVNFDFEYGDEVDEKYAIAYTQLIKYTKDKLEQKFENPHITVSTFADSLIKQRITQIPELSQIADRLFIMAYDFHRPNSDVTGPIAPIGGAGKLAEYDIDTMLEDYLSYAPPKKLILGVPYYGYNWVVENEDESSERIPGTDEIGYSQSQMYADIMETILEHEPEILWNELGKAPYFNYVSDETNSKRQVYFENPDSLKEKYRLAKEKNLAGVGIWALGYDKGYQELWELLKNEFGPDSASMVVGTGLEPVTSAM
jgi:spore germination protein YaaH